MRIWWYIKLKIEWFSIECRKTKTKTKTKTIDPSTVFSTFDIGQLAKIYRHSNSNMAKFERDTLQTVTKTYVSTKSGNFTDVCMLGASLCPQHTNVCKILRLCGTIFAILQNMNLKFGQFPNFKVFYPAVSIDLR